MAKGFSFSEQRQGNRQEYLQRQEQKKQFQQQQEENERYNIELAKSNPEQALPEYKEKVYQEARNDLQKKVDEFNRRIADLRQQYSEVAGSFRSDKVNAMEIIENKIREQESYRDELKSGLSLSRDDLIKQYYSGYIENKAQISLSHQESITQRQEDIRDEAKRIGIPVNVYKEKVKEEEKKQEESKYQEAYGKYFSDKYGKVDTTLTLGATVQNPTYISESKPLTTEEKLGIKEYNAMEKWKSTPVYKAWGYVKGLFQQKQQPQQKEYTFAEEKPIGIAHGGTITTKVELAPELQLSINEQRKLQEEIDNDTGRIFENYEKKIASLTPESYTQENINKIKMQEVKDFNKELSIHEGIFYSNVNKGLENIEESKKGFFSKVLDKSNKFVGQFIPSYEGIVTFKEKINTKLFGEEYAEKLKQSKKERLAGDIQAQFGLGVTKGIITSVHEKPVTIVATAGAWYLGSAGLTVASTEIFGAGESAGLIAETIKVAKIGMITGYIGSVAVRTFGAGTSLLAGEKLGKIGVEEILPMSVGISQGVKLGQKAIDIIELQKIKTSGDYAWRSPYKLTYIEQLRGEKGFKYPQAPVKKHVKLFQSERFKLPEEKGLDLASQYHATSMGDMGEKIVVKGSTSELPILYGSPQLDITFAVRGAPEYKALGLGSLKGTIPFGARIYGEKLSPIPKGYKPKLSWVEVEKYVEKYSPDFKLDKKFYRQLSFMIEREQTGRIFIPQVKTEIESGLFLREKAVKIPKAKKYYTQIAKPEFYQKLEKIRRLGNEEFVRRVQKFSILKPSTYLDKLVGRKAGQFKTIKVGRVLPIEKYKVDISDVASKLASNKLKEQIFKKGFKFDETKIITGESSYGIKKIPIISAESSVAQLLSIGNISSSKVSRAISSSVSSSYGASSFGSYSKSSGKSSRASSLSSSSSYYSSSLRSYLRSISRSSSGGGSGSGRYYGGGEGYPSLDYGSSMDSKIRKKLKWKKSKEMKALLPDFTAILIGSKAPEYSVKQAIREMNKIQSGFHTRWGGNIKGFTPYERNPILERAIKKM